ncbi:MAG TPA: Zn-ribbon domain-containing OB-fold protein [bacterium]|nr:Zn-ribbon domain-containing OB-fold protein [bacterium]
MSQNLPAYEKPLPVVDGESRPFWEGCRRHQLVLQQCQGCGRTVYYPRALCPFCHSDRLEWKPVSGEGSIYAFTIARRPAGPAFKADVPYVVALIQLKEGARMMSNIRTAQVESVRIGQKVRVVFEDVTPEITLPKFEVAPE